MVGIVYTTFNVYISLLKHNYVVHYKFIHMLIVYVCYKNNSSKTLYLYICGAGINFV